MKRSFLLILITITCLNAQHLWEWQNPYPQGEELNDIHIFDSNSAIAVGYGKVLRTSDGGITWQLKDFDALLNSISFVDTYTGWIAGFNISSDKPIIIYTKDGGENWVELKINTTHFLSSIFFVDLKNGWLGGDSGSVFITKDGGESWKKSFVGKNERIKSVHFVDTLYGWAVGRYTIFSTSDGGNDWKIQKENASSDFENIFFSTKDTGWIIGNIYSWFGYIDSCFIFGTTDAGKSWEQQFGERTPGLFSIKFRDGKFGYAVGGGGRILQTDDGGKVWKTFIDSSFRKLDAIDIRGDIVWAVGEHGTVVKTDNAGINWVQQSRGSTNSLASIFFHDTLTGWAAGNGIQKTIDGGKNWNELNTKNTFNGDCTSIYFLDENIGWAVGFWNLFSKSIDGGITWEAKSPGTNNTLLSIQFVNYQKGWAVGNYGTILKTTDGGETWIRLPNDSTTHLRSVYFKDESHGWMAGLDYGKNQGLILRTTDGGDNWTQQNTGYDISLFSVYFENLNRGWAVGDNGHSYRGIIHTTTNSGLSWDTYIDSNTTRINSIRFTDSMNGWAVGEMWTNYNSVILKTEDGGKSWFRNYTSSYNLNSILKKDSHVWIVGDGGTILHMTKTGTLMVELPSLQEKLRYSLMQNYPNPFNPFTTISFAIPTKTIVSLKIFDLLGREIANLVDEEKTSGEHSAQWNASALSSGIYFYRLQAGDFSETKKLLLLK